MKRFWKKLTVIALAAVMTVTFAPFTGGVKAYAEDQDPAPIQDIYEIDETRIIDGVTYHNPMTYYNTGSIAFTRDKDRFFRELLGNRTDNIKLSVKKAGLTDKSCSISDAWLLFGLGLTQYNIGVTNSDIYEGLAGAAVDGAYYNMDGDEVFGEAHRYDPVSMNSLKEAEEYVLGTIHKDSAVQAQLADHTMQEPVVVSAVNMKQGKKNTTLAAYFSNFRVAPILPEDTGSNYVTTTLKDNVSIKNTTAYAIKNNTASSVSGTQSLSTSASYSVSSSVSGSESYSYSESIKYGGGYEFPVAVKLSIELGFTASQAISKGWSSGESYSDSKTESQSVSVTLPPYTSVMLKTKTTEAEYVSRYNCPVALVYDVTLVGYNVYRVYTDDPIRYTVFNFKNQTGGARGDVFDRTKLPENYTDDDGITWTGSYSFLDNLEHSDYWCPKEILPYITSYVPMSSTGATFKDSATVVSSEIDDFMPLLPLRRIKIAEPNITVVSDELDYGKYSYYTAKMNVGDYSFANYMSLVAFNEKDAPYYSFSKDNGYWELTDMEGNVLDNETAPVELVKDPVSGNWRYTAVRPGTCFLVYRIFEDYYATADAPEDYMTNAKLFKTAALEIVVADQVAIPEATALTYTGELQTGVEEGEGYTLTGNTATDAGTYTAVASLKDKKLYTWSDGTTEDKKITWKITAKKITPTVTLSATSYTWNGNVKKPTVTVKYGSKTLTTEDYTVTYASGRKNVGTYKITVKLKGNYSGSKSVTFKINPKGTSIKTLTATSKGFKVTWAKQTNKMSAARITGYQIQYCTSSKFATGVKTVKAEKYTTVTKAISKLTAKKKYYVRVRTYKKIDSKNYYSPWSAAKAVTTKA